MISPFEAPDDNSNITYINHGLPITLLNNNMFKIGIDLSLWIKAFAEDLPRLAKTFYEVPIIKEIYKKRKEFDLIVFDWSMNEVKN